MANAILNQVAELANEEYNAAIKKWGMNHSRHESYAVMQEEIEEAEEELGDIRELSHSLWENTKSNANPRSVADQFSAIQHHAIRLAVEALQVAVTARKGAEFELGNKEEERWEK